MRPLATLGLALLALALGPRAPIPCTPSTSTPAPRTTPHARVAEFASPAAARPPEPAWVAIDERGDWSVLEDEGVEIRVGGRGDEDPDAPPAYPQPHTYPCAVVSHGG